MSEIDEKPAAGSGAAEDTPSEFALLMEAEARRTFAPIAVGSRVEGRIVAINPGSVLVDIGQRSEGVVPIEQLREGDRERLKVGDTAAFVISRITGSGIELAWPSAGQHVELTGLMAAMEARLPIEAKVSGENKGGFVVDLPGARGFVPFSQMEIGQAKPSAEYIGRTFSFRIKSVRGKEVVLSRSDLLRDEQAEARKAALATLAVGQELDAPVVKVEVFGAFIDVGGGVHALVPTSEMSWSGGNAVRDSLRPGMGVRVKLIALDTSAAKPKITASMKQVTADPWSDAAGRFAEGQKVQGKVVRIAPFGAFVEVAPGIEGLVHISQLSASKRISNPGEVVAVGQQVDVLVVSVDSTARRIGLSISGLENANVEVDPETRRKYLDPKPDPTPPGESVLALALKKALEKKNAGR